MGYPSVEEMDADHDDLHSRLCSLLGVASYSLAVRDGERLSQEEWMIANYEEDAVLCVQRWLRMERKNRRCKKKLPHSAMRG
jgi:hypothetical protein